MSRGNSRIQSKLMGYMEFPWNYPSSGYMAYPGRERLSYPGQDKMLGMMGFPTYYLVQEKT
jgi:hypothetical protein